MLQAPEGGPSSLVLGGGIAGLLAAHVACKHFNRVTLVDADGLVASAQGDAEQVGFRRRRRGRRAAPPPPLVHLAPGDFWQVCIASQQSPRGPAACLQAAKQRRGIPQYLQLHTLVTGGLQAIEAELPGFKAEVRCWQASWGMLC